MPTPLLIMLALPFFLVFPGWFIADVFFSKSDRLEKSALSVLLSMAFVYTGLFVMEKTAGKLTPLNTLLTIIVINLFCAGMFVFKNFWKSKNTD